MKTKKNLQSLFAKIFGSKKKDTVPEKDSPVLDIEKSVNEESQNTFPESGEKTTKTDYEKWIEAQPYGERTGSFVINIPSPSGGYHKKKNNPADTPEDHSNDSDVTNLQ